MSLRELARRLAVTPSYVSDIENNRRVPSEDVLRRIADELNLDFDDLVAQAGRIGTRAERYLRETPAAATLFRRISEKRLTEDEVKELIDQVDSLRADGNKTKP
jgi:transcriptional regulator with XRE-family HTH domain